MAALAEVEAVLEDDLLALPELELELLPQPTVRAEAAVAVIAVIADREGDLNTGPSFLSASPECWHTTRIMAMPTFSSPLRERRRERGFTQAELAERAGVSRQLVAAVESGRNAPAVDAAIGLARVLASTVEELFADPGPEVVAALGGPLPAGAPLRVGRVGSRLVACELADHGVAGAGWARADGVIQTGRLRLFSGTAPAGLVIAGCDPMLGLAEAMLPDVGPRSLLAISAPTGRALRALKAGHVHAALVHGPPGRLPTPASPTVRWQLVRWQVGLAVARAVRQESFEALLSSDVTIAHREPAAASQQAFERAAAAAGISAQRSGPAATGHIDAARIAAILTGAAVTNEAAARAFDLRFLTLEDHTVELWLAERWREHPGIASLGELLATSAFTQRASQFAGYDLTGCGASLSGTAT